MQGNFCLDSTFLLIWFIRINLSNLVKVIKLNNNMKIKLQRMSKSNVTHIIYGLDLVWSS